MKRNKFTTLLLMLIYVVVAWLTIANCIQAFKCPKMTQTELFLHIPKTFIGDFDKCD